MSNIIDLQQFMVGKTFHIPTYQRDFAWTTTQVDELLSDIQEAIDTGSGHYLGTIVLAGPAGQSQEVVDGQQRLSTLSLVIQAFLQELDVADPDRIANEAILLRNGTDLKLDFGNNRAFVNDMILGRAPVPNSVGQRKLLEAFGYARDHARSLKNAGGVNLIKQWVKTIKMLEIIQFVAVDTGRAIRMFQTVNDRGIPLSAMDKAKALLVYYSNRYLAGRLDNDINLVFGECFSAFDSMREFVNTPGCRIDNIARDTFTEDDILRYHYLAYSHPLALNSSDYAGTIRTVFDGFLKATLKHLSQQPNDLEIFIKDYIEDLRLFANAFRDLILSVGINERYYRLFVVLGLAARLYPLTIRLFQRGELHTQIPGITVDLLHCIEVCDVRVYKTRGTDPAKDVGDLGHGSRSDSVNKIAATLREFTATFMPDGTFETQLGQDMYHNGCLVYLLMRNDESISGSSYTLAELKSLVQDQITREHIIAQSPNWAISSQGFKDETDFTNHLHMFGNLTLLSKSENSRCQNEPTHTKMTDTNLYAASKYAQSRQLAHKFGPSGGIFQKKDIIARTTQLSIDAMNQWKLW